MKFRRFFELKMVKITKNVKLTEDKGKYNALSKFLNLIRRKQKINRVIEVIN